MGRPMTTEIKESVEELKKIRSKQRTLRHEKRIMLLILIRSGECDSQTSAAKQLGISRKTANRIMKTYRETGLASLSRADKRRRCSKFITPEIHQGLEVKLRDGGDPLKGYWHAQQWVGEEFGSEIAYNTLRTYIIKHFKTKLKRPRKSHYKKDPKAKEAFLKTPRQTEAD